MASRRRAPIAAPSGRGVVRSRLLASKALQLELRRELGLAPTSQLELDLGAPTPASSFRPVVKNDSGRPAVCSDCGRWGYHLVGCRGLR